ncbi:hypothetical protein K0040_13815 [Terrisporobacter petrolearius]|uniref:hypothetical protein n=1 Tax=Terrisporobacter petrolearius TaxID=1460447 RepID=UPI001D163C29|nr:hypothetical protein [Terrisporobacter petrolearius]MCC3865345.1 hypothetical protein [Terrisporobacter petrolearius]
MSTYKRVAIIDENGNVDERVIGKNEELVNKRVYSDKEKYFINQNDELRKETQLLGGYIHMYYVKNELLFNDIGLDPSTVSRLIYLATYINYNNKKANLLVKYGQHKEVIAMTKADIRDVMNLSKSTFNEFITELRERSILLELDNKFYINNKYFERGSMSNKCVDEVKLNNEYTRIFINTTRELYRGSSSRQHKHLGYVFKLIPFLNYSRNILTYNTEETNFSDMEFIGLKGVCELLGVNGNKGNDKKLEKQLLKLKVNIANKDYYIFKHIVSYGESEATTYDYFVMNPRITWRGKELDDFNKAIEGLSFRENTEVKSKKIKKVIYK